MLVMDIDGREKGWLNVANSARLVEIDIVAGVHDRIVPGVTELLRTRFADSHTVMHVPQMSCSVADIPQGLHTEPELMCLAMDECRGDGNDWLWMKAKSPSS